MSCISSLTETTGFRSPHNSAWGAGRAAAAGPEAGEVFALQAAVTAKAAPARAIRAWMRFMGGFPECTPLQTFGRVHPSEERMRDVAVRVDPARALRSE